MTDTDRHFMMIMLCMIALFAVGHLRDCPAELSPTDTLRTGLGKLHRLNALQGGFLIV